jgi:hypothetical protein
MLVKKSTSRQFVAPLPVALKPLPRKGWWLTWINRAARTAAYLAAQ